MKKLFTLLLVSISFIGLSYADIFSEAIQMPEVKNIQLKSFSPEENSAVFVVDVYNPNAFKLPVREIYGDMHLNDHHVADVEANSKRSLAAHATETFTVPIEAMPNGLVNAATSILTIGVAKYSFKGNMMTPVGEIPLLEEGELTTEQIMALLQAALSVQH